MASTSRDTVSNNLVGIIGELLECCIHAVLHARGVYPARVFERRRVLGVAVMKARHPKLIKYISDATTGIKEMIKKNQLKAIAVVILGTQENDAERGGGRRRSAVGSGNGSGSHASMGNERGMYNDTSKYDIDAPVTHVPLERIVFRLKQHESKEENDKERSPSNVNGTDSHEQAFNSLRAILTKLSMSDALLSRPYADRIETFELVAYTNSRHAGSISAKSAVENRYIDSDGALDWVVEDGRLGRVEIIEPKTVPIKSIVVGGTEIDMHAEQQSNRM